MGSLVAAVVANIYMEECEEQAIANATCKPKIWKLYVDDTFTVLDRDHVNGFLQHLNSQQPTTRFTMEIKKDNTNPLSTQQLQGTQMVVLLPLSTVKRGIVKCLYDRAEHLTTKPSVIPKEETLVISTYF